MGELTERDKLTSDQPQGPSSTSRDALIDAVFERLVVSANDEQQRVDSLRMRDTPAMRHRREVYLDLRRRVEWQARAKQYLARRPDVVNSLSEEALYSAILMQHLIELEADNLKLPPELRRSEDTRTNGLNDQFLLDVPRSRFTLNGEVFHMATNHDPESREEFVARLSDTVRRLTPQALLEIVTIAMSQCGMAALMRAGHYSLAVIGGVQQVEYTFQSESEMVRVTMFSKKHSFREYLKESDDNFEPSDCDASSSIRRSATIAFGTNGDIDVVDIVEEIDIRVNGQRLAL